MRSSSEPSRLRVEQASPPDLPSVRAAYDRARAIQEGKHAPAWPDFGDDSILDEIRTGRLFRVMDGDALAGVFTVAYDDAAIWDDMERGAHIYLHRIARTDHHATGRLIDAVMSWALARCEAMGREGLRIDTWADNAPLVSYYGTFGFHLVRTRHMVADPRLPPHYAGLHLALMERPRTAASAR